VNSTPQGDLDGPYPICEFGEFRLDVRGRSLTRADGQPLAVTARVLDVLIYLVRNRGVLIRRDDLIDAVWPDTDIEPNNLNQHIAKLRRLLGERTRQKRFIETVAGRGYRFIADVRFAPESLGAANDPGESLTRHPKALEQYRQALRLIQRPTADNFRRAAALLESALALDPQFAHAWAWLADVDLFAVNMGRAPPERLQQARRHAEHALSLRPGLAIPHVVLGVIDAQYGAWLTAESHFVRALSLDASGLPEGHTAALALHASFVLEQVGQVQRALQQLGDAYRRMPDDPRMLMNLAMAHLIIGPDTRATECADLSIAFGYPEKTFPLQLVYVHAALRACRFGDAAEQAASMLPEALQATEVLHCIYRALEAPVHRELAVEGVRQLLERMPPALLTTSGMPMLFVEWFTQLERLDLAFDVANRALDTLAAAAQHERPPNWQMLWLPELLPLRSDRRFRQLAERLGFIPYWRAHGPPDCPAARRIAEL